jgi:M6 family metalloprotease-like protein
MSRLLLVIVLMLMALSTIYGAYLSFQPIAVTQPNGTKLDLFATGDEFYNWLHDKNGYTVKQNDKGWYVYLNNDAKGELQFTDYIVGHDNPADFALAPWVNISAEKMGAIRKKANDQLREIGSGRAPSTGTLNNISIFIRFSDQTEFGQNISVYNSMFNGTTGNTMQSYFLEASYNTLNISTTYYPTPTTMVVSWQDSHPRNYYSPYNATTNPDGYQGGDNGDERADREFTLLANAVNGVNSQVPTGLNLDGDNDGKVDNVCFIIKGSSDGWASLLWPHRWSIYDRTVNINGKRVYDFNFQLSEFMASRGVGVLCHEMFHSLGSPDLYHYTSNGISTVGSWDLMENDQNPPQHMGAFMKYKYGHWIASIPEIIYNGSYTLNPLTSAAGQCYKIASPNSSTEYFVVEFRKDAGTFESSLPGSGMLIYRINPAAGDGNADGPPDEVYVYRPGGTPTANGTVSSANFSSETGRITFNNSTNPYCFLSNGALGGLSLSQISSSAGSTMSFFYGSGLVPGMPVCQITAPATGSGFNPNSTVSVTVTATDSDGTITSVAFYVDDVLKNTDTTSPYAWNWNTSSYGPGQHIIKAIATDNSSNTAQSSVAIIILAPPVEGFETGNFSAFAWTNNSAVPWTVQSSEKLSGTYAARSGAIGNNATTTLSISRNVALAGNISFWQKVSSETDYDFLTFYIDGVSQGAWSGSGSWSLQTYSVSTGVHTFTWTYAKDMYVAVGSDCAWLDHIDFPMQDLILASPQNVSASAGNGVVNLAWEAVDNATEYHIYASTDPFGSFSQIGTTSEFTYEITTPLAMEFFYVKAANGPARKESSPSIIKP